MKRHRFESLQEQGLKETEAPANRENSLMKNFHQNENAYSMEKFHQNGSSSPTKRRRGDPSMDTDVELVSNREVEENIAGGLLERLEKAPPGYQFDPSDDEIGRAHV